MIQVVVCIILCHNHCIALQIHPAAAAALTPLHAPAGYCGVLRGAGGHPYGMLRDAKPPRWVAYDF